MRVEQILRDLKGSGFAREQLPAEHSLGLPRFRLEEGGLILCLVPHRILFREGRVISYPPGCYLELPYPFQRLRFFQLLEGSGPPMCLRTEQMSDRGRLKKLFQISNDLLAAYEGSGLSRESWERYSAYLGETIKVLGLRRIYAPIDGECGGTRE